MRRRCAFTLVELLVVIAIITVLAGIILAVLPAARKRSYEARCMSNLRQLGQAFAMYKQDWGGVEAEKGRYYEPWQLGLPPATIIHNIDDSVTMVIGEFQLWKCPFSPSFSSPYATDYSANFVACFEPPEEDPLGACSFWKEAVFRLGQKAWLLLDDNHMRECRLARRGHGPVILLNLDYEVRRFAMPWDASLEDILWREH